MWTDCPMKGIMPEGWKSPDPQGEDGKERKKRWKG